MPGRLDTELKQAHDLNRLAGRNRVFSHPIERIADSGIVSGIIAR